MHTTVLPIRDERGRFLKHKLVELPFDLSKVLDLLDEFCPHGYMTYVDRALSKIKKYGFEQTVSGYYKVAFLHPEWVIKKRVNRQYNSIPRELRLLRRIKNKGKLRYIPDTFYVRGYMIQRRFDKDYDKWWAREDEIDRVAETLGITDVHWHNVGWDGDRFVFIDFDTKDVDEIMGRK